MRKLATIILLCFSSYLLAQSHVLPSLEVLGEAPIKIPLGPKTSLPFVSAEAQDSLPDFYFSSVPNLQTISLPKNPALKGRFAARLTSAGRLGLSASLYNPYPKLSHAKMDIYDEFLSRGFHQQNYQIGASVLADSTLDLDVFMSYKSSSAKAYQADAFTLSAAFTVDDIAETDIFLKDIHNRFWWETSFQNYGSKDSKHQNPGFWHSSSIQFEDHVIDSSVGTSMGRLAIQSSYRSNLEYQGVTLLKAGLMSDMYHLLPYLDVYWQKSINPDLLLIAANNPSLKSYKRSSLLEEYPWAGQNRKGRAQMSPINLNFRAQHALPTILGQSLSLEEYHPQNHVAIQVQSAYIYNDVVLVQNPSATLPALSLQSAWKNSVDIQGSVTLPWGMVTQSIKTNLEYLPHQNMIRKPYSPLVELKTAFIHEKETYQASINLNQHYFMKDQQGRPLSKAIDLSLLGSWKLMPGWKLCAEWRNIFGLAHTEFKGLPLPKREVLLGVQYLWR